MVLKLISRVDQLERNQATNTTSPQAVPTTKTEEQQEQKEFKVSRVVPRMKRLGQHSYVIKSLSVEQPTRYLKKYKLIMNVELQSFEKDFWRDTVACAIETNQKTYNESVGVGLATRQKKISEISVLLNEMPTDKINIKFEETGNRGSADFTIYLD